MNRAEVIQHKGKKIVQVDLSTLKPDEIEKALQFAQDLISRQGVKAALVLTDVTNATYDKNVAALMKDFVAHNTPYIRASAVVGADGVRHVLLQTVIFLSHRDIKQFDQRDKAKDWLATF